MIRPAFISLVLLLTAAASASDESAVRHAVQSSLRLVQNSWAEYPAEKTCFTCHNHAMPIFAASVARVRGFEVDWSISLDQARRGLAHFEERRDVAREGKRIGGGPITVGYALASFAAAGIERNETTDALSEYLLVTQEDDGRWKIRSHRPPSEDSDFTPTALAVRGLQRFAPPDRRAEAKSRIELARQWIIATAAEDNEARTFRLLGLKWSAAPKDVIDAAVDDLLRTQREDGGWAQLADMSSDAYATGQALVALHLGGGASVGHPAYQRGVKYLLGTQLPDASWRVTTRSKPIQTYYESGFPHGDDQFISIDATCWSVMALAVTQSVR